MPRCVQHAEVKLEDDLKAYVTSVTDIIAEDNFDRMETIVETASTYLLRLRNRKSIENKPTYEEVMAGVTTSKLMDQTPEPEPEPELNAATKELDACVRIQARCRAFIVRQHYSRRLPLADLESERKEGDEEEGGHGHGHEDETEHEQSARENLEEGVAPEPEEEITASAEVVTVTVASGRAEFSCHQNLVVKDVHIRSTCEQAGSHGKCAF